MTEPVIEVENLKKRYALGDQGIDVLEGVDLRIDPGELVAVMGPSGVGKSTLLGCAAGLTEIDGGKVNVLGHAMHELDDVRRTLARRQIGIIYQFFHLVENLTVLENITLPYLIAEEPIDEPAATAMLERVGLTKRRAHRPPQLSGGEMQLCSIARALVRRPKLVLADEPTGNVNVATGRRIMDLLVAVLEEQEAAMLLVTHNPEDAARAHRVVFMIDGRLATDHQLARSEVSRERIHERLRELRI